MLTKPITTKGAKASANKAQLPDQDPAAADNIWSTHPSQKASPTTGLQQPNKRLQQRQHGKQPAMQMMHQHSNPQHQQESRRALQCDCTVPALRRPSHRTVYCTVQRECGLEGWLQ
jgi:hypothetical protein